MVTVWAASCETGFWYFFTCTLFSLLVAATYVYSFLSNEVNLNQCGRGQALEAGVMGQSRRL